MRDIVFKIKKENWSLIRPNDWISTEWIIYNDLLVDIKNLYNDQKSDKSNTKKKYHLTLEQYNNLVENIKLAKEENINVNACDGVAWEIIQYSNGKEIWKRNLDYIYGIKHLEKVENILYKINEKN
jgi:hypothetical protein